MRFDLQALGQSAAPLAAKASRRSNGRKRVARARGAVGAAQDSLLQPEAVEQQQQQRDRGGMGQGHDALLALDPAAARENALQDLGRLAALRPLAPAELQPLADAVAAVARREGANRRRGGGDSHASESVSSSSSGSEGVGGAGQASGATNADSAGLRGAGMAGHISSNAGADGIEEAVGGDSALRADAASWKDGALDADAGQSSAAAGNSGAAADNAPAWLSDPGVEGIGSSGGGGISSAERAGMADSKKLAVSDVRGGAGALQPEAQPAALELTNVLQTGSVAESEQHDRGSTA